MYLEILSSIGNLVSPICSVISVIFAYRTLYQNHIFEKKIKKEQYDIVFLPNKQYAESPTCEIESLLGDTTRFFDGERLHRFFIDRRICYGANFKEDNSIKEYHFLLEKWERDTIEAIFSEEYTTKQYNRKAKKWWKLLKKHQTNNS